MRFLWVLVMMLVGAFNATQAPINAGLARRSNIFAAVLLSFLVGTAIMIMLTVITGSSLSGLRGAPAWQYLGGLTAVVFIVATAFLVTRIGLAAVVAANVAAQLAAGMVIDRWGLFGLERIQISWVRAVGALVLLVGVVMVTKK